MVSVEKFTLVVGFKRRRRIDFISVEKVCDVHILLYIFYSSFNSSQFYKIFLGPGSINIHRADHILNNLLLLI